MKPFKIETIMRNLALRRRITDSDCWLWTGQKDSHGYGTMMIRGVRHSVSRVALHIFSGFDLNSPLDVCHRDDLCNNRDCFNPEHLYAGTRQRNIVDSVKRGTH